MNLSPLVHLDLGAGTNTRSIRYQNDIDNLRICPGQYLAMASLWIVMATILATIDISKAKDEDGKQITPLGKMTSGLTR